MVSLTFIIRFSVVKFNSILPEKRFLISQSESITFGMADLDNSYKKGVQ